MNIKRCPFCGSDDLTVAMTDDSFYADEEMGGNQIYYTVWCDGCQSEGPREPTQPAAEMSWNNRED